MFQPSLFLGRLVMFIPVWASTEASTPKFHPLCFVVLTVLLSTLLDGWKEATEQNLWAVRSWSPYTVSFMIQISLAAATWVCSFVLQSIPVGCQQVKRKLQRKAAFPCVEGIALNLQIWKSSLHQSCIIVKTTNWINRSIINWGKKEERKRELLT